MNATQVFLQQLDATCERRKREILDTTDDLQISGKIYYVSVYGNDSNDGLSPDSPWKTLEKVSSADLNAGDGVLFHRGELFRGYVIAKSNVCYGAYGSGDKPKFYGWNRCLADPKIWSLVDSEHNIWKLEEPILDSGTLVFNHGNAHSVKLIPSYIHGKFVCRNDESKLFDKSLEMTQDLDLYWHFDSLLTTAPSKGESFPIPLVNDKSLGELYLRCDSGNPGEVFDSIEALPHRPMFIVGSSSNVRIDNLCLKYIGTHAIAAGGECVKGLCVTNCEIGWVGGTIQHYYGTDPNYPQGGRGSVTRFGNGIEIYGGCDRYTVSNCYIYQVYDAGMTHQITTDGKKYTMTNVLYKDNLVEKCVYSIEYFLAMTDGDTESYMDGVEISGNILRFCGYGWGQQRHNTDTPAHIKGWSTTNRAANYIIRNNIFDRSAYRMLHLVAEKRESCPLMLGNTYIQNVGGMLGQYGATEHSEPPILMFDDTVEETIQDVFKDEDANIYMV